MYPQRAHILAPLTALTSTKYIQLDSRMLACLEKMKALLAHDTPIVYHHYTHASEYHLGSVILQPGKPVAFYFRKLTPAQRNYTTMEKELLSIVEILHEFHTMLFGSQELNISITLMTNLPCNELSVGNCTLWNTIPNATISKDPIMHSLMP